MNLPALFDASFARVFANIESRYQKAMQEFRREIAERKAIEKHGRLNKRSAGQFRRYL